MLRLDMQMVKIEGVVLRTEEKDGELVTAVDISILVELPNTFLAEFHPSLKSSFYCRDENAQEDMLDGSDHLTVLKFPSFPRFPWKGTSEGYQFIGHTDIGGPSEIKLPECKINKTHLFMKQGGVFAMDCIIRAYPLQNDIGKLSTILEKEVQITLIPPDEAKQFALAQAKEQRRAAAEGAFKDPHTQDLPIDEEDDPDFREVEEAESPPPAAKKVKTVLQPAEAWPFPTGRNPHVTPADKKPARRKPAAGPTNLE